MNCLARGAPPGLRGFTLIEMLVTIAIVGVLATLTAPSFRALAANHALSSTTQELMTGVLTARAQALKNNQGAVVAPLDGDNWVSGWQVFVDGNSNGSYQSGTDTVVISREALDTDIVEVTTSGTVDSFRYKGDGFSFGAVAGSVMLKSTYTGKKKCIVVASTGRPRIFSPADDATTCPTS